MREATAVGILEAAEAVALRRGLDATSIAAIAEHAGVAVGTLYNYFPDRDALLTALFKLRHEELKPQLEEVATATRGLPFEQRLRAYVTGVFEVFERSRRFCALALSNEAISLKARGKPTTRPSIVISLADILRPVAGAASDDYAGMMFGAIKQLMVARFESGEPLPPAATMLVDTFLRGMKKK